MTIHKIRRPDGKFSRGGTWAIWGPRGKTWNHLAHVKAHLRMLGREDALAQYGSSVLLSWELDSGGYGARSMQELIAEMWPDEKKAPG